MQATYEYHKLLEHILDNGTQKGDRTGTGTVSIFDYKIKFDMAQGFPLITTKKMFTKGIVTELLWFLSGNTNIKPLVDQGNYIWVGDAYKAYTKYAGSLEEPDFNVHVEDIEANKVRVMTRNEFIERIKTDNEFANIFGELGPVYGRQWRNFGGTKQEASAWHHGAPISFREVFEFDQITDAINTLKNNPDSRRIMVSAWNPKEMSKMVLPPCHWAFEFYTEELTDEERYNIWFVNNYETGMERYFDPNNLPDFDNEYYQTTPKRRLHLKWHQRSVDTGLGLPFNIASYAFLLHMFAQQVDMVPGTLVGDLTNVHIYNDHIDKVKEQLTRPPHKYKAPMLRLNKAKDIFSYKLEDFEILNYESFEKIAMPLSN